MHHHKRSNRNFKTVQEVDFLNGRELHIIQCIMCGVSNCHFMESNLFNLLTKGMHCGTDGTLEVHPDILDQPVTSNKRNHVGLK